MNPVRRADTSLSRASGSLGSLAYELVKERLLDGGFRAGDRISLEALKAELAVSKQPIMEAMRRLAADGLIEIIPQVGCQVPRYTANEIGDFYTMFGGMEGAIAGIAAERWTGHQLDRLHELNARLTDLSPDDASTSHQPRLLNREFHAQIHRISASRVIADVSQRMWDLSDLLINTAPAPQPLATAVFARAHDHDEICRALEARDADGARRAMETHIVDTVGIIQAQQRSATGT